MKKQIIEASFFLLTLATANADVTIEQSTKVDAAGAMSLAAMDGTTVTSVSANNARTDNDLTFKSALMRTFAGGAGKSSTIIKLDEERIIDLDLKKKRYTETSFAEMRAQTEQAMQQMEEATQAQQPDQPGGTNLPVSEQNCEWTDSDVSVNRSGARQSFAGFEAEQSVITATQTCQDPETGKSCDVIWTMENWLSPEVVGGQDMQDFWTSYAQKLGFDETVGKPGMSFMAQLFSQYQQGWDDIETELGELQGYPLKTVLRLEIGGDECTTDDGQPISNQNVYGEGMSDAIGGAVAESAGNEAGGPVGGVIAKGLFKAFGKKKKDEADVIAEAPPEPQSPGSVELFRVETETTRVSTAALDPARFEIPKGFKPAK
jgi:hypothetical protein